MYNLRGISLHLLELAHSNMSNVLLELAHWKGVQGNKYSHLVYRHHSKNIRNILNVLAKKESLASKITKSPSM